MLITDSIFQRGSSHLVCQDYAIHSPDSAVGSDGCSSSDFTDVGARLLSHYLLKELVGIKNVLPYSIYPLLKDSIIACTSLNDKLNILSTSLDVTCFGFKVCDNEVFFFMSGDGYIYLKFKDGTECLRSISFEPNMPFYSSYFCNDSRKKAYESEKVMVSNIAEVRRPDSSYYEKLSCSSYNTDACGFVFNAHRNLEDIEMLLMFSDGLGTFKLNGEELSVHNMVDSISKLKVCSSGFLKRKIVNGIKKDFDGVLTHSDDLSIVGLYNV